MELRQLRYFVKVAECGSLGRTATELGVVTSALSQQISRLETELSTRLLTRTSTGVVPTDAGLAQTFPARPISLIVPHSAGGTSDILARTVAAEAGKTLKQTIVVENKGGSPALSDLLGGQVDFMFTTLPGALPHIKAGSLKALAVTSPERSSALPQLPTMAESGLPGFSALSWHGIVAPAVIATLNDAFSRALQSPEVKQRLAEEGARLS